MARYAIGGGREGYDRLNALIAEPQMTRVQAVYASGEDKELALSTLEATGEAILAEGIASSDEFRSAVASLAAHTAEPGTIVAEPRVFQLWSRRPPV